ncbi:hypothetical protein diail_1130 [Diaporthe ilicicola]|nr:hypothetical protein diail_1130 [Diaporthe ilicicola]
MSGDDQAPSFGDPNARPPTPQRTPTSATSAAFSSPLLETPKQNSGRVDEATGWTPHFAEDYSVFNSTPGNLRASSSAFHQEFAPLSPVAPSTGKKRPLSAEGVALEIATHANHFSTDPQNLAPVGPSRRLPSSPDPLTLTHNVSTDLSATPTASQHQGQRSAKKYRASVSSGDTGRDASFRQAQTATPPPSSRGGRKIAPKLQTDIMQHQNFAQPDFSNAPQTQHPQINTAFVTGSPEDVFGYPMGPATAPPITGPRPFWGMDMDTNGMGIDVDITAAGAEMFQASQAQGTSHQPVNSLDWGRANQVFQQTSLAEQQQQQQQQQQLPQPQQQSHVQTVQPNQSTRRERPLAPKTANTSSPKLGQASPGQNYSFGSFQMSMDDPFSTSPGGVDPGLLFSQQPSLSMSMDLSPQRPSSSAPFVNSGSNEPNAPLPANDIRRSKSTGAQGQRNHSARAPAIISPTKSSAVKPGLSRSFSESARAGKRTLGGGRPMLPNLAPAPMTVHQPSLLPSVASQSNISAQPRGVRSGGRRSPVKSSHHHRLSSLTSIPENAIRTQARQRSAKLASVKFVIDEDGRAHTETVVDDKEDSEPVLPTNNQQSSQRNSWAGFPVKPEGGDDEYSSSSDDEPIIIPSRNTSFNFSAPPRSSGSSMARPPTAASSMSQNRRQRSVSERSSVSSTSFRRNHRSDPATSLLDQMDIDQQEAPPPPRPSTGSSLGDAAAELRKVMQAGSSKRPGIQPQVPPTGSGGSSGHRQRFTPGQRSSSSTISATPSPTHNQSQGQVRCVCNRPEAEVDGLLHLIKCDSCDHMLHGRCVDVPTPQDVPHVYICAFCANTPNMRGGRMRYTGRNQSDGGGGGGGGMMGPPVLSAASVSSPLAHKSFRSFR